MNLQPVFTPDEKAAFRLRTLYRSRGYRPYNMSKFEEYDLYVRNKDFLVSDNVITFTDTNGRLMALKPDVTLSIIKNGTDGTDEKVYYTENVYRVSKGTRSFKEIMQAGLECIGTVDDYQILEVLTLAAESLRSVSDQSVLDVSHLGIVSAVLEESELSRAGAKEILSFLGEKNLHGALEVCAREEIAPNATQAIKTLFTTYGTPAEVLPALEGISQGGKEALDQLRRLTEALNEAGIDTVRIDFSVINHMSYYNGIVFRGFVEGIPTGILSGGQYDNLMKKLGRKDSAIGFAVYLDLLEDLFEREAYDTDTVLLYPESADPADVAKKVAELSADGERVSALRTLPEKLTYRRVIRFGEED